MCIRDRLKAIPEVRPELSKYAPKMLTMTIDPDKIREVIGSGGKMCIRDSDDTMLEAIMKGFEEAKKMVMFIKGVQAEIGKPKFEFPSQEVDPDLFAAIKEFAEDRVKEALDTNDKNVREARLAPIVADIHEKFDETHPEQIAMIDECIYKLQKYIVRRWLLDEQKRVDGRGMDEIRPLAAEVGLIPRVHGSGMFTRGQTQVLTIATLGTCLLYTSKTTGCPFNLCQQPAGKACSTWRMSLWICSDNSAAEENLVSGRRK